VIVLTRYPLLNHPVHNAATDGRRVWAVFFGLIGANLSRVARLQ
jgi:hypothetical protein